MEEWQHVSFARHWNPLYSRIWSAYCGDDCPPQWYCWVEQAKKVWGGWEVVQRKRLSEVEGQRKGSMPERDGHEHRRDCKVEESMMEGELQ